MPIDFDKIPAELKALPRWAVWIYDDKHAKVPLQITTGKGASSHDRTHWGTFEVAKGRYLHDPDRLQGLGFAFFPEDGIVGVDFDKCRDPQTGVIQEWVQQEIQDIVTYAEVSPSLTGIKLFGFGKLPKGKIATVGGSQTELYDGTPGRERYFTVTGLHLLTHPLAVQKVNVTETYKRMLAFDLVEAFRRRGWLTGSERGKKIGVHCPWSDEHSKQTETTVLINHEEGFTFSCLHGHCANRKIKDVYKFFRFDPPPVVPDGSIRVKGGDLTPIINIAEESLLGKTSIYQRGGVLMRPVKLDTVKDDDPVRRCVGSTVLTSVKEPWLVEQMGKSAAWLKWSETKGKHLPVDPPRMYAETLIGRGEWRFPALRGIATAPTITRAGRIIELPGYDAESGLLLDFQPGTFPRLPAHPTKDDAAAALSRLEEPLREFLFAPGAKAVALSAILTGLVRLSLRTAPLHAYDAPVAGSGKSLLAEMVGLITTGMRPPAMSQGKTEEEDEKRLSTILSAGDAVIHIDNCERELTGDFLCSMLTQETVQARILGQSERRVLPTNTLVLASGNNMAFAGDISRRVVPCRLDPQTEHPENRVCSFDCHEEVITNRQDLVIAGLTILLAYIQAGLPEKLPPVGSFSDWAWIRGALVWLGCGDPAAACLGVFNADPRRDELTSVMEAWNAACGSQRTVVSDIEKQAEHDTSIKQAEKTVTAKVDTPIMALRDKLMEVACRGKWSGKSVGWWLRKHKDRIVNGKCFRSDTSKERQAWWLEDTTGQAVVGVQATMSFADTARSTDGHDDTGDHDAADDHESADSSDAPDEIPF